MTRNIMMICVAVLAAMTTATVQGEDVSSEYRRAVELLESTPLIDGHNDVPWQYRERADSRLKAIDLAGDTTDLDPPMHTDLSRLRAGRVGGQFWSVYVDPAFFGPEAVQVQIEQIDTARRLIERHDELEWVTTAAGVERAFEAGRIASLLGMEGGHTLDNSLANLRAYYALGARYLTLTHWQSHDWADAATDAPRHGGLTNFGREVVSEMNRLGMLVDLSHVSPAAMRDALETTTAPVIFSHSSAQGVTAHPRNVPDGVLDQLPGNGGVVMVTFVPGFINDTVRQWGARQEGERARLEQLYPESVERVEAGMNDWRDDNPRPKATLADVADHIDYIRDRIGAEYIGIGGDFDGISSTPEGLEDVSGYPALFAELIRRGYSDEELKGIMGENLLRVLRHAEKVSQRLRAQRPASDAKFGDFAETDA